MFQENMDVLAFVKDSERYVFFYDDVNVLVQVLERYAEDEELGFTLYDSAVLSQKIRKLREENKLEEMWNRMCEDLSNLVKRVNQESIPLNPETCLELNIEFLESIGLT